MSTFAQRLKEAMERRGLCQQDIANRTGINKASISNYISGKYEAKQERLHKIAQALSVSEAWLSGYDVAFDRVEGLSPHSEIAPLTESNIHIAPLYESVSAGFGAEATDYVLEYLPIYVDSLAEANETILIRVTGDSMSPKIENGDIIQVWRTNFVEPGSIAVVLMDTPEGKQGLVKKVRYGNGYVELISLNEKYQPMRFSGTEAKKIEIVGLVRKILKNC